MEKPDFKAQSETIYQLENARKVLCHDNPGQYMRREAYVSGCEHVWNTHVVPLEQKISDLMIENTRVVEGDRYRQDYFKRVTSGLQSENKALREENTRLTTNFIEHENAAESPNDHLSYWQYQQFTRAAITKLKEELVTTEKALRDQLELLKEIERLNINQPPFR